MDIINLSGKVALISGASSGIGAGTAVLFSKLGAKLAITGRKEENLKKTADECEKNGCQPLMVVADLSKEDDVKTVMEKTISHFGKLNILVNCAGILAHGSIETSSLKQFDEIFNVNVRSVYQLTMLAVPHLIATQGSIVNVSSICGLRAFPGALAYDMSKSALDQFTCTVALELASKKVRVNSVNPGFVVTEIHKRTGMSEEVYAQHLEKAKRTHVLGRAGEVDDVAKAIAFLASDASSFITGALFPIDGGRQITCPQAIYSEVSY
ncbi:3-oxoacyl-[acyl-carrier-protein] reductase FabG [Octopus bimaculoides]|uniref:3-oxoacyl-[acyl-carrier-protein] reductase FabG n=2 Tax=Octopus bimaculoides TaxID=37653 RepID=A0A0L8HHN5_OCTBM|nr:3-oxoacyl-[acyl-carrier-protein] reductase FabG [Octopus bimaculoides]XP_052829275.1 3-oxoacyl-[acyl-carrier-protein] reductase FabG [Octopus bimaculoides]|eukprot:XP_014772507.1 PREDICTED: 3-oxoacyl-[acyl-carrier-protein] reductase FabG-like [Octopus bimaculoides]